MKKIDPKNAMKVFCIAATGAVLQILSKAPFILNGKEIRYDADLIIAEVCMSMVIVCLLCVLICKIVHHYHHN
jgi:hypothetical protein